MTPREREESEKVRRVTALLEGRHACANAHMTDNEWIESSATDYCRQTGCLVRCCVQCAGAQTPRTDQARMRFWCWRHVEEGEKGV